MKRSATGLPGPRLLLVAALLAASASAQVNGNFPVVAAPAGNPVGNTARENLGHVLFWEEQLSSDNTMACGTCHITNVAGGTDPRGGAPAATGEFGSPGLILQDPNSDYQKDPFHGVGRQATNRNAPTMINAAFFNRLFWDVRAGPTFTFGGGGTVPGFATNAALETQAVGPPLSSIEMAHQGRSFAQVVAKLGNPNVKPLGMASNVPARITTFIAGRSYPQLFQAVFGASGITRENIAIAIAAYERTLVSNQAPIDGGINALTQSQRNGFLHLRNNGCLACHSRSGGATNAGGFFIDPSDSLFTDGFRHIVLPPPFNRLVKTPTLRNMGLRKRFFHAGHMGSVAQILAFYNGPTATFGFNPPLNGVQLAEVQDFFVNALTDPRVAAGTIPFDRPTLNSEINTFQSNQSRFGTPGTGGLIPVILGDSPPNAPNPDFKVGVGNALGGAPAFLGISPALAPPGTTIPGTTVPLHVDLTVPGSVVLAPIALGGINPGDGVGTTHIPIAAGIPPNTILHAQWLVQDPGAAFGFASTRAASFTTF